MKLPRLHLFARALSCFLLTAFLLCTAGMLAQDKDSVSGTFRIGKKNVIIPPPSADFVEIGNDYRSLAENMVPENNRLVAAFLLPEELKAIGTTKSNLTRYALVEVPRRAEFSDVTPDMFKELSNIVGQQFGALLNSTLKDTEAELNRKLKNMSDSSATIALDKPTMLGVLFNKPNATCFGSIMPVRSEGKTTKIAMGIVLVRVQERIVFAYLYAPYQDDSTVKWIKSTSESWATAILAANQ